MFFLILDLSSYSDWTCQECKCRSENRVLVSNYRVNLNEWHTTRLHIIILQDDRVSYVPVLPVRSHLQIKTSLTTLPELGRNSSSSTSHWKFYIVKITTWSKSEKGVIELKHYGKKTSNRIWARQPLSYAILVITSSFGNNSGRTTRRRHMPEQYILWNED